MSFKILKTNHVLIFLSAVLLLTSCSGNNKHSGMTPFPDKTDIEDEQLVESIADFIKKRGAPPNSEYDFVRVDLNEDGRRDGIVLFKLPHTYWCGWDGCGMLILTAGDDAFTPLSTVSNVRGPIYVSEESNNGWRDIIVRISGANMADKNIILQSNGRGYPQSPLLAPTLHRPLSTMQTEIFFR